MIRLIKWALENRWKINHEPKRLAVAARYDRSGRIYRQSCGHFENSIPDYSIFERALAIRKDVFGPDHPEVARSLERLARCHGYFRYDESKRLLKRALTIWEKALGPNYSEVAWSFERLARYRIDPGLKEENPMIGRTR